MQFARRYWVVLAAAGVLASLGTVALNPLLLAAGLVLGLWLFAHQVGFVQAVRTVAAADVSLGAVGERVAVDAPVVLRLQVATPTTLPFDVAVTPTLPPSASRSDATRPLSLQTGEGTAETAFEASARVVGQLTIGPPVGSFRDEGGLFVGTVYWDETVAVDVRPRALRSLHVGEGGDPLTSLYGDHRTDVGEAGIEPAGVREYVPGDQLSRIDWKATARLNHPHLREFELQTARETLLVIDHRASMGVGPAGESKLECLREVALAFVDAASEFDDPLGLYAVGDEGTTTTRDAAGVEQYEPVRRAIAALKPTTPASGESTDRFVTPARARTMAARLDGDQSRFAETLRPYVEATEQYVHRLDDRPLFRTVRAGKRRLGSGTWTVILTDDTEPAETREAVKLARRNGSHVLVFLAPSVLYEPGGMGDLDGAFDRYVTFEEFRTSLAAMDRVSAFEVAPGDRLAAVIGRHERPRRSRRNVTRGGRRYRADDRGPQNPLAYSGSSPPTADTEDSSDE